MKKLLMAVAALGMLLTSCAKDDSFAPADQETIVSFSINTPEITTRYGEGEQATQLHWAVYDTEDGKGYLANISSAGLGTKTLVNGTTTVELSLVDDRSYDIIFWAQNEKAPYKITWATAENKTAAAAQVCYTDTRLLTANDETLDAFYASIDLDNIKGAMSKTVELKRPFAQLNIATADTAKAEVAGINVVNTGVEVKNVYTAFGLQQGDVRGEKVTLTFSTSAKAEGTISANDKSYDMLSMNYLLVKDKSLVDIKLMLQEANTITSVMTRDYTSVPVERNYRTNIIGNILTSDADFNVEVNPDFTEGDLLKWDGELLSKPTYNETTDTYRISHGAELAWIAALVNGTLPADMRSGETTTATAAANSLEGATIVLEHDIDLGGKEWTPIGTDWTNAFAGTFNGNGYAIRNIKISKATDNGLAALFGTIRSALIQNLVIENADITCKATTGENHFFGAGLVSVAYVASTIDNVIVKDSKIQGNNKVGGLVGYNANNGFIAKNCKVIGTTVESVNTEDGGSVGGLIGSVLVDSDKNNTSNIELLIENCHIEGSTIKGYNSANAGKRASSAFIGVLYVQNNDWELNINGCSVDAATTFEELNTECTYTSPYGELIGGLRADDGKSCKVIIDGELVATLQPVVDGDGNPVAGIMTDESGNYYITAAGGLSYIGTNLAANDGFAGKTITLNSDITLTEEFAPIAAGTRSGSSAVGTGFKGTFDGNGKTIDGLEITNSSNEDNAIGFFGIIDGGEVKNMNFTNVDINIPNGKNVGTVAGLVANGGKISGVTVSGNIEGKQGTGGIAGRILAHGTIENCTNNATVSTSSYNIGGIVGAAYYTKAGCTMSIKNCTNNGAVNGSFNGAGGIAGLSVADIEGCTNTGDVSGKGEGVGGIAGEQSHAGSIIGCRNEGNITNSTSSVTGGIVGWIRYNGNSSDYPVAEIIEIKNNTNTGEVLAAKYVGGIVGTIYNYGFIENNKNEAPKITATADTDTVNGKAAGIVGYALCADNQGQDGLTAPLSIVVKNNTSTTTAENILGAVTNLIINQGGTGITVEGNTPAGI